MHSGGVWKGVGWGCYIVRLVITLCIITGPSKKRGNRYNRYNHGKLDLVFLLPFILVYRMHLSTPTLCKLNFSSPFQPVPLNWFLLCPRQL